MKRLALVLVLVLAMVAPAFAQGEPLEIGMTKEGSLKDSIGTFTFSASAQQVIVFELVSTDFDPFLEVQAADGDVLISDDDGGSESLNSRIVFVAPEAGEYSVVVRSYGGDATGAYTLTSTDDIDQLAFGESVEVALAEGGTFQTFFIAEENDVINLTATAADEDVDTNLTLVGPDGVQVEYSEDFNGINPALSRVILPATGMYAVTLAPYSDDDFGDVTLFLEKTELPMLSADGMTIKFSDGGSYREIAGFETTEGTLYEITFTFDKEANGSIEINGSSQYGSYTYFSFSGIESASFSYRAEADGLSRVKITNSGYDLPTEFTVTVAPVE